MFLIRLKSVLFCVAILSSTAVLATDPSLKFIPNKNQWAKNIQFSARIPGGQLSVEPGSFCFSFIDKRAIEEDHLRSHLPDHGSTGMLRGHGIRLTFHNINRNSVPQGFGESDEYYNYFLGSDPSSWATKIYAYQGFLKQSIYPGIDLKVYSIGENLKYDYIVSAGADPGCIRWSYEGADRLQVDDNGNVVVGMSLGEVIEKRPVAYQLVNGQQRNVDVSYRLMDGDISFVFPNGYDECQPLVIDPLLIFSTYSGSTADNWGSTATPGEHGTLYSAGVTNQTAGGKYPATSGAFQVGYGGNYDIGILKYDSTGSKLLYASYLGGTSNESPHSLVIDKENNLIVLGTTESTDFPTTAGAYDRGYNGGTAVAHVIPYGRGSDIVISKISPDGSRLIGSTFLGGSQNDGINHNIGGLVRNYGDELRGDVITDDDGNVIISSVTSSPSFPVVNGYDLSYNGGLTDAVVVKLNPGLSQIIWSTFLGGSLADASYSIKLDSHGDLFLAGGTASSNFPTSVDAFGRTFSGEVDGWIVHLSSDGVNLLHSTLLGTTNFDQVYFVDLNSRDDVYVYGQTNGTFPITAGVYSNRNSGQFIQKYNSILSVRGFSTVIGSGNGVPDISPTAFLINDCDNIYLSGWGGVVNSGEGFWKSSTAGLPISGDAVQKTTSGSDFYFMVLTDDAQGFLYGTYLGGTQSRTHVDGGTSRFDKAGVVYHAVCSGCKAFNAINSPTSDFPTTSNAWSHQNRSNNCNNAAFKFDLSSLKANLQTNNVTLTRPGLSRVCIPDSIVFQNLSIGGEIFKWDLGDGTKLTKTSSEDIVHQYQNPGVYLVKLKALDAGTCREVDSTSAYVTVSKSASFVQPDDNVCEGSSYQLKAYGGVFYEWLPSADALSKQAFLTVAPTDTTKYFVTITEKNGCRKTHSVTLNVIQSVQPKFDFRRVTNCFDRPILEVKNLTDSLQSSDQIFFDFGDNKTSDAQATSHAYAKDGFYQVSLTASRSGCIFQASEQLAFFKFTVPNVITPGMVDGKNDKFFIQFGEQEGVGPADYGFSTTLTVYNRWGEPVLKSDDYKNDWTAEGLAAGVYYYEVEIKDHGQCRSWLHVVK